jgi:transglutaminase-like putative cysteine protease
MEQLLKGAQTLRIDKRLRVQYAGEVSSAVRRLRLLPIDGDLDVRGEHAFQQILLDSRWQSDPRPDTWRQETDERGAPVLHLEFSRPHTLWRFAFRAGVRREKASALLARASSQSVDSVGEWLLPSALCDRAPEILSLAANTPGTGLLLCQSLNRIAHRSLRYLEGASDARTTASQALAQRSGVCQDYAHILIALCRARGIPARYVSGYGPAPGRMHAWVQVLEGGLWHAFDPTNGSPLDARAVTVAVGRDYRDVLPLEGRFHAPSPDGAQPHLETFCRLEPVDGL